MLHSKSKFSGGKDSRNRKEAAQEGHLWPQDAAKRYEADMKKQHQLEERRD